MSKRLNLAFETFYSSMLLWSYQPSSFLQQLRWHWLSNDSLYNSLGLLGTHGKAWGSLCCLVVVTTVVRMLLFQHQILQKLTNFLGSHLLLLFRFGLVWFGVFFEGEIVGFGVSFYCVTCSIFENSFISPRGYITLRFIPILLYSNVIQ